MGAQSYQCTTALVRGVIHDSNAVCWRSVKVGVQWPNDRIKIRIWYKHDIHDKCKLCHIITALSIGLLLCFGLVCPQLRPCVLVGLRSLTYVVDQPTFTDPWSSIQLSPFPFSVNHLTLHVCHSVCLYLVHISLHSQIPCTCLHSLVPTSSIVHQSPNLHHSQVHLCLLFPGHTGPVTGSLYLSYGREQGIAWAWRVGRGIALLFHDRGTKREWVDLYHANLQLWHYTRGLPFSFSITLFWTQLYVQTCFSNKWANLYEGRDKIWGKHVISTT